MPVTSASSQQDGARARDARNWARPSPPASEGRQTAVGDAGVCQRRHAGNRSDERSRLYTSKQGLELQNISGRYGPFWVAGAEAHLEPLADSGPEPMSHPGEELVLLLDGRMIFTIDGDSYELEPGDSIHFRTVRPHSWANLDDRPARAIWLAIRGS